MSQAPRNGLAKLLWDADSSDNPQEIAARQKQFECPECGWKAKLRRNACMVCDHDQPLRQVQNATGESGA